jgi:predicted nuclease of predicted toxin-antitoxin system
MPRILLDTNMPTGLRAALPDHEVVSAPKMGWGALENGELLAVAEADGFDMLITGDKNIAYQQRITGRRIANIVLSTNHWPTVRPRQELVVDAASAAMAGSYAEVALRPPPLIRRRFKPSADCETRPFPTRESAEPD